MKFGGLMVSCGENPSELTFYGPLKPLNQQQSLLALVFPASLLNFMLIFFFFLGGGGISLKFYEYGANKHLVYVAL